MKIGKKVIERAAEILSRLMRDYHDEIDVAYMNMDKKLRVGLFIELSPGKVDSIAIKGGIAFIESQIKDESPLELINENQGELELTPTGKKEPYTTIVPYGPRAYQIRVVWVNYTYEDMGGKGIRTPGGRGRGW